MTDILNSVTTNVQLRNVFDMMNVSTQLVMYKEEQDDVTKELTLFDTHRVGKIMEHPIWSTMLPFVRDELLVDAFSKIAWLHKMFEDTGLEFASRYKPKDIGRVIAKSAGTRPDNSFKVLTDWIATRIPCQVDEIYATYKKINNIVKLNSGVCHIKAHVIKDGKMTDIVMYVYACIPKLGYVVEMQIGHPFAFVTFTLDSAKRDATDKTACVDLWDHDFYGMMKKKLLDGTDFEIDTVLNKVFEGKKVDPKLESSIRDAIEY